MRDGTEVGVSEWMHPDDRVNRVLIQKREAEVGQAVDRLRLIHAEEPKLILILGRLPVDATIDRLVEDPLSGMPGKMLEALDAADGALPLSPAWMAQYTDVWGSVKAAKRWIERLGEETGQAPISYKSIYIENRGLSAHAPWSPVPGILEARYNHPVAHRRKPKGAPALIVDRTPRDADGPYVQVMLFDDGGLLYYEPKRLTS
jgi:hypothetical protein